MAKSRLIGFFQKVRRKIEEISFFAFIRIVQSYNDSFCKILQASKNLYIKHQLFRIVHNHFTSIGENMRIVFFFSFRIINYLNTNSSLVLY